MASSLFVLFVSVLFVTLQATTTQGIVNTKIDRIIDLSSQLVRIVDRIYIDDIDGPYKITPDHPKSLAYIDAILEGESFTIRNIDNVTYEVDLKGKTAKPLVVTCVYIRLLEPYPAEIRQADRQLVRYNGYQTSLSPYLTKAITTRIKLPTNSRLESFTRASIMTTGTNKITYGPFKDIPANKAEPLMLHFENNSPFYAVTTLMRDIEVSPWARSINIVNQMKVAHVGAKLKGPFSRIEFQRDHGNGLNAVRHFGIELPKLARDIFYRDGIGNITTSSLRKTSTHIVATLKPRFPLFGGWMTDFILGYKVPSSSFLNEPASGNNYRLSIPFIDIMHDQMFVEDATVKITLPAGSTNIEVVGGQIDFERGQDEQNYSYLDVIGRPVIVLKKRNVVNQHLEGKPLVVRYNYTKIYMIQEPILLIGAAIGTLILTALYSKMSTKVTGPVVAGVGVKAKSD